MSHHLRAFGGALAIAIALFQLASTPVAGQAPRVLPPAGPAPTTSWGAPDLQGIWYDPYQIPMQRLPRDAGKEARTDQEIAELDRVRGARPPGAITARSEDPLRTSAAPTAACFSW